MQRTPAAVWWALLAGLTALVFWQSARPAPAVEAMELPGFDKLAHAAVHAVWVTLAWFAIATSRAGGTASRRLLLALALAALHGLGDELHQAFVPEREADPADLAADVAGAAAAAALWWAWLRCGPRPAAGTEPE